MQSDVAIQREYYAQTAKSYNEAHLAEDDEHYFALSFLLGAIDHFQINSILDVGAGTGRAMAFLKSRRPNLIIKGIEPVGALREVGYQNGLSKDDLIEGDATEMDFQTGEFDLVCEFGVLHHIPKPELAVAEMLRVAKKSVFISDSNNFGQGSTVPRTVKQVINGARLWKLFDFIKTRGKGYSISEGDGLFYSYSVFNNYAQIRSLCKSVHILNTQDTQSFNLYRGSGHVALLGLKK